MTLGGGTAGVESGTPEILHSLGTTGLTRAERDGAAGVNRRQTIKASVPTHGFVDPVELARTEEGAATLYRMLVGTGYRPTKQVFLDLILSLRLMNGWFLSGPKGCGKTECLVALAESCGLEVFRLQGMEGLGRREIIGEFDAEAQSRFSQAETARGRSLDEVEADRWSRRFFRPGAVPGGFDYAYREKRRCLIHIDEEDKLPGVTQDMMLQPLQEGRIEIPGMTERYLGFPPGASKEFWPIVVVTSNENRNDASSPFRSRFGVYTPVTPATDREKVEILRLRCPEASQELLRAAARMLWVFEDMTGFTDKPGIREMLYLIRAFTVMGVSEFTERTLERFAGVVAKRQNDWEAYRQGLGRLEGAANQPNATVDEWVDVVFEEGWVEAQKMLSYEEVCR